MSEKERPKGKPTEQTTIIVCDCGSTGFQEEKRTTRAVVFKCSKCGEFTSVQGRAAFTRVALDEVTFAVHKKLMKPDPEAAAKSKKKQDDAPQLPDGWKNLFEGTEFEPMDFEEMNRFSDEQKEYVVKLSEKQLEELKKKIIVKETLRFSMTPAVRRQVRRALEGYRIMHHGQKEFDAQTWQGPALGLMAADSISGHPKEVSAIIDAMDESIECLMDEAKKKNKKWSKRKETKVRNDTRAALCEKYGLGIHAGQKNIFEPKIDAVVEQAMEFEEKRREERKEADTDDRILDNGYLHRSLIAVRGENGLQGKMLIGDSSSLAKFQKLSEEKGGFVLRVDGDKRTRNEAGVDVCEYVWLEEESEENHLDFMIAYLDEIDDVLPSATLEVVELLPSNYYELEPWDPPMVADRRE